MGSVEGPAGSKDTWKVKLESGMVFEFQTQNLQDIREAFESLVAEQPVAPAMAGKTGSVEGPAGSKDTWKVRLESGMVFEFQTQNLQDIAAPAPSVAAAPAPSVAPPVAPAMAAAPAKSGQATDDELEFTPGQQVRILAPPAMAGKMGSVE